MLKWMAGLFTAGQIMDMPQVLLIAKSIKL